MDPMTSTDSVPLSWTTSGSIATAIARMSSGAAFAVTATIRGRRSGRADDRIRPARSAASGSPSARGVPGTRLSPIASAPDRMAARAPSASVTPQILTNGRRATLAGSAGSRPAATNAAAPAAGIDRPHQRLADERAVEPAAPASARPSPAPGHPDSAMTSRSSGTSSRRRPGTLGVDVERPQVAVVEPDQARARRERALELASVVGLDQRLQPEVAAPRRRGARAASPGGGTARSRTRSAPAARSMGSWRASTTKSLARTGTLTDARTARRSSTGAAEPVGLAQDRDRGSATGLVRPRASHQVVAGYGDHAGRRRRCA